MKKASGGNITVTQLHLKVIFVVQMSICCELKLLPLPRQSVHPRVVIRGLSWSIKGGPWVVEWPKGQSGAATSP